eukprot:1411110-Amphidinium_carterae.1
MARTEGTEPPTCAKRQLSKWKFPDCPHVRLSMRMCTCAEPVMEFHDLTNVPSCTGVPLPSKKLTKFANRLNHSRDGEPPTNMHYKSRCLANIASANLSNCC